MKGSARENHSSLKDKIKDYYQQKGKAQLKSLLINHNYVISLILLLILGRIASDNFLSFNSLMALMRSSAIIGIIALGMTLVIISGNIDLSVGSLMALVAANTAIVFNGTHNVFITLLFALAFGAFLGFVNGVFIGKAKVAAFIVTLATMAAYRSLTIQQGEGGPVLIDGDAFMETYRKVGYSSFLNVPYVVWIFVIITILIIILMTKTKFGRYVYAVGSNEKAARLSGINVDRIKIYIFSITGLLTGLASFIYVSRFGSVDTATAGKSFELDAIAAVAIGGTSMAGGKGFIQGTFFGIIVLYSINAVLTAFKVPSFVNDLIKGILILGAVLLQKVLNERKSGSANGNIFKNIFSRFTKKA
ncbi:ABC transporter permease [Hujiaoplasma nucleasis]|uniref:ABC transporter permease n=1 Tax=Hujiaoplasma nucleasis TaxID=2725268 RepID=A0A7L6N3B9_9MOLU|nr:ABC transporter permease [Hujiaoplasma nucleasis]QLY39555.1 ABC transporter permease [Hujiaoplasma nucleasis]